MSETRNILVFQKALLLLFTGVLHRLKHFLTQAHLERLHTSDAIGIDLVWLRYVIRLLDGEVLIDELADPHFLDFLIRLGESLLAFREFHHAIELLRVALCAERIRTQVRPVVLTACRAMNMTCEAIVADLRGAGIDVPETLILDHSDRRLDETLLRKDWTPIKGLPKQFREKLHVLQQQDQGTLVVWIPALNSRFLVHIETDEPLWNARTLRIVGGAARIVDLTPSHKKQLKVRSRIDLKNPELEVERFIVPI